MIVSLANLGSFRRSRRPHPALPAPPPGLPVSSWARSLLGFTPDPLQTEILDSPAHRLILLCSRQFGKSTLAAIKALHFALAHPAATILVVSPTLRRSAEWLRLVKNFFLILANPAPKNALTTEFSPRVDTRATQKMPHSEFPPRPHTPPLSLADFSASSLPPDAPLADPAHPHSLLLPNRSRILALPGTASTNRGYSAHLLIFEEAAFIPDPVFAALAPCVAATRGALWLLSSAGEPSGFFYELWSRSSLDWSRFIATASECPRITEEFLAEARLALGEKQFRREYFCEFAPDSLEILTPQMLESALDAELEPWMLDSLP
jgi:hypothetical protein